MLSRRFAVVYPARQLPGPLYALNAAVVLPLAPFTTWAAPWRIVALLAVSVAVMVVTSVAIFDLFSEGSAAAVTAGTAVSPLAAITFSAVLLPASVTVTEVVTGTIVAVAVLVSLADSFAGLTRGRALGLLVVAAGGNGLLTVLGKDMLDAGAGIVEIYFCRTFLAALVLLAVFPPRDLPLREIPRMTIRASAITASFLLILLGLSRGSPATVQTMVATAPLMLVLGTLAIRHRRPPRRVVGASLVAVLGVLVVLTTAGR